MYESPSEKFKKRKARYDTRKRTLVDNPWDYVANSRPRNSAGEQSYPYKGFDKIVPKVKQRDNYTCQWCKRADVDLEVHHIDGNKENNRLDNLITVCLSCHRSHHNKRETRERIETEKWRRNYYAQRKMK